ncbi:8635_t:CDS:10 [Ambispora gerdemannii]|uniref:8635_t:CDS:1 n=1 Tax=Ambispora gerdemannii TaxID=144530 RepID=A0A9N9B326_9GLOM|nr:8635_t:CDS:10 [Ambispora gerdemannii]
MSAPLPPGWEERNDPRAHESTPPDSTTSSNELSVNSNFRSNSAQRQPSTAGALQSPSQYEYTTPNPYSSPHQPEYLQQPPQQQQFQITTNNQSLPSGYQQNQQSINSNQQPFAANNSQHQHQHQQQPPPPHITNNFSQQQYYQNHQQRPPPHYGHQPLGSIGGNGINNNGNSTLTSSSSKHKSLTGDLKKAGKGILKQLKVLSTSRFRTSVDQYQPGFRPPVDKFVHNGLYGPGGQDPSGPQRTLTQNALHVPNNNQIPSIGQKPPGVPYYVQLSDPPVLQSQPQIPLQQRNEPSPDIKIGVLPKKKDITNQSTSVYSYQQSQKPEIFYPPPPPIEYPPPPTEYPAYPPDVSPKISKYTQSPSHSSTLSVHESPNQSSYSSPDTNYPQQSKENDYDPHNNLAPINQSNRQLIPPPSDSKPIEQYHSPQSPSQRSKTQPKYPPPNYPPPNYPLPDQNQSSASVSQSAFPPQNPVSTTTHDLQIKHSPSNYPPSDQNQSSASVSQSAFPPQNPVSTTSHDLQIKHSPSNYPPSEQDQSSNSVSQSVFPPQNPVSTTSYDLQLKYPPPNYLPPEQNQSSASVSQATVPPQHLDLSTSYHQSQSQQAQSQQPPQQHQYNSQDFTQSFSQTRYEVSSTGPINVSVGSPNVQSNHLHLNTKPEKISDTEISQNKSNDASSVGFPNTQSNPLYLSNKAGETPDTEMLQNKYPPPNYPPPTQYYSQSAELSQSGNGAIQMNIENQKSNEASDPNFDSRNNTQKLQDFDSPSQQLNYPQPLDQKSKPLTEISQNKYSPPNYPPPSTQYYSQSAELSQSGNGAIQMNVENQKSNEASDLNSDSRKNNQKLQDFDSPSQQLNYPQPLDQPKSKPLHPIQFYPPQTISSIPSQNSDKSYPTPPSDVNPNVSSSSENEQSTTHSQNQAQKYPSTPSSSERKSSYPQSGFSSSPDQTQISAISNQPSQYIIPILSEQTRIQKTPPAHHSPNYPAPPSYQGQYTNYLSTEQKGQFSNSLQWKPSFDPLVNTDPLRFNPENSPEKIAIEVVSPPTFQQEIEDSITELMKTIELGSPKLPNSEEPQNLLLQQPFSQKPMEQPQQSQYPHQAPQVYHYQPPQQQSQFNQQQQYLVVGRPGITLHDPGFLGRPGDGASGPTTTSQQQHQQPYLQQQHSQHMQQNQKQYY